MSEIYDSDTTDKETELEKTESSASNKNILKQTKNNANTGKNATKIHEISKSLNQISYQTFNSSLNSFFKEIDENKFRLIVGQTEVCIDEINKLDNSVNKKKSTLKERLLTALVDEKSFEDVCENVDFEKELHVYSLEEESSDFLTEYFQNNKILANEKEISSTSEIKKIAFKFEEQVKINNNRKRILQDVIKQRMQLLSYRQLLRIIDSKIEQYYLKKIKTKRKKKEEESFSEIEELLDQRDLIIRLFQDIEYRKNEFYDFDDLFNNVANVDTKNAGYEPSDYL